MIRLLVLYPRTDGTHFDSNYWLTKHMPMLAPKLPKLKKWEADIGAPDSPYYAAAHIYFDSIEDLQASLSSAGAGDVMGDIPNYTDTSPVILTNTVTATS